MKQDSVLGIALAGGGARGAYTAGVMRFIFTKLSKELGYIPWPHLVSGTSVGALNGYFAACHSPHEIKRMTEIWTNLTIERIYTLPVSGALSAIRKMVSFSQTGCLFNQEPLRKLILEEAARRSLRHSIAQRKCRAFIVSATHLTSGENTLFVDTQDPDFKLPPPPQGRVFYTKIYPEHLLASAAIPLLFPPERIADQLYIDGGTRQNAPLQPIIQGGVNRILVLGTRTSATPKPVEEVEPSLALIAGKTLNALTLDPVERDTRSVEQLNKIILWGTERYGQSFATELHKQFSVKPTKILHLRPSEDLGKLAFQVYKPNQVQSSYGVKWLLQKIYDAGTENGESDLLSQLLFDRSFTAAAEDLGYKDTEKRSEELLSFFTSKLMTS